jgi:nucleoside-diphosphate-sugar epimerase
LLDRGITTIHAAVRDSSNKDILKYLNKIAERSKSRIKYFDTDLLIENSYEEAMTNCELVFHIASPFKLDSKNPNEEVIKPALYGTRNVLKSVNRVNSVKKVVLTSSVAAIYGDSIDSRNVPKGVFDESMWNTTSSPNHSEYSYSKMIAEKEAWKIYNNQERWDLAVINPSFVIGPSINPYSNFESKKFMLQMGNGDLKRGVPDITLGVVDVRDVAEAHVKAGFNEKAKERYIVSNRSVSMLQIAKFIRDKYGDQYPVPTKNAPKFLVWLIAPLIGVKRSFVKNNVGYRVEFNNNKSKEILEISYSPIEKAVTDFFQQFIDHGSF